MKRLILGAAIALIGAGLVPARAEGNLNFNIGQRYMSDSAWEDFDLDTQDSFGLNLDFGEAGAPVHVAFGLNTSGVFDWNEDDNFFNGGDTETAAAELSAGFLWTPKLGGRTRPFLGAGISRVGVTVDLGNDSDSDTAFGFYANGGVFWHITQRLNMGFDVRTLQAAKLAFDANELGVQANAPRGRFKLDANHVQLGFLIGFNWGNQ
jgi:opacity protein-like surface antigen